MLSFILSYIDRNFIKLIKELVLVVIPEQKVQ